MTCPACPFAMTEQSESIQNLGCLPTPYEAMQIMRGEGKNWCCHEDETKPCAGQVSYCREEGISYDKAAPLASYTSWYYEGTA
jgi:hypothetical protein